MTASSAMFGFCGFVVLMEMLREHPYSQCAGSAYFLVKMGLDGFGFDPLARTDQS